jgi:hypothetical protein
MQWLIFAIAAAFVGMGIRRMARDAVRQEARSEVPPSQKRGGRKLIAQDMEPCPRCGAYVLKGAPHDCNG